MTLDLSISSELLEIQRIALKIAEESFNELKTGMTEIDATEIMYSKGRDNNISKYFHFPFAWFGDRTMFKDFSQPLPILSKSTWQSIGQINPLFQNYKAYVHLANT
jgi:hypothetical protein